MKGANDTGGHVAPSPFARVNGGLWVTGHPAKGRQRTIKKFTGTCFSPSKGSMCRTVVSSESCLPRCSGVSVGSDSGVW